MSRSVKRAISSDSSPSPTVDGGPLMIVQCENCETRFHVADARIPAKGARVRCSRCHHRFHITPSSSAPPAQPVGPPQGSARAPVRGGERRGRRRARQPRVPVRQAEDSVPPRARKATAQVETRGRTTSPPRSRRRSLPRSPRRSCPRHPPSWRRSACRERRADRPGDARRGSAAARVDALRDRRVAGRRRVRRHRRQNLRRWGAPLRAERAGNLAARRPRHARRGPRRGRGQLVRRLGSALHAGTARARLLPGSSPRRGCTSAPVSLVGSSTGGTDTVFDQPDLPPASGASSAPARRSRRRPRGRRSDGSDPARRGGDRRARCCSALRRGCSGCSATRCRPTPRRPDRRLGRRGPRDLPRPRRDGRAGADRARKPFPGGRRAAAAGLAATARLRGLSLAESDHTWLERIDDAEVAPEKLSPRLTAAGGEIGALGQQVTGFTAVLHGSALGRATRRGHPARAFDAARRYRDREFAGADHAGPRSGSADRDRGARLRPRCRRLRARPTSCPRRRLPRSSGRYSRFFSASSLAGVTSIAVGSFSAPRKFLMPSPRPFPI